MPYIDIQFASPINASCQVGDEVYKAVVTSQDSNNVFFQGDTSGLTFVGTVHALINPMGLDPSSVIGITLEYTTISPPTFINDDFLIFNKAKAANTSGIKGYYAKAKFSNNSKTHAELFAVGAVIQPSSK